MPTSTQPIPIALLDAHPLNSNVVPKPLLSKLKSEIARTGLYPPIIARPIGERYQILDGHHRVRVLEQLGRDTVDATVWDVDDEQALVLLASLNRMRGEDDPRKRAALLDRLTQTLPAPELAKRLPEDAGKVRKLLALHAAPPSPQAPPPIDAMPTAVHFFLLPAQRKAVEQKLREQGGPREAALLQLLGLSGV